MIILPQTLITEKSFKKWKCHRIEVDDDINSPPYTYYVIPLVDITITNKDDLEKIPTLFSSYSDEFMNDETSENVYTVRLDPQLPELVTEQEVELLYKILVKKDLLIKSLEN